MNVQGPVQEMPVFTARADVDPTVKDHWGIPVARISGHRHPHDLEIARFIRARAEQWLKAAGANAALTFAVEHQDAAEPDAPEPDPAGGDAAVKKALGVFGGRVRPAPKK